MSLRTRNIGTFGYYKDDNDGNSAIADIANVATFGWFDTPPIWTEESESSVVWTEESRSASVWTEEFENIVPPTIYFGHPEAFFGNFFFGQALRVTGGRPVTGWTEETR